MINPIYERAANNLLLHTIATPPNRYRLTMMIAVTTWNWTYPTRFHKWLGWRKWERKAKWVRANMDFATERDLPQIHVMGSDSQNCGTFAPNRDLRYPHVFHEQLESLSTGPIYIRTEAKP